MSIRYQLIEAKELDAGLQQAWRRIQAAQEDFLSPYFCPEFTLAVAAVRTDVRVVVIERDGRPVGFFPHQCGRWGQGCPLGGALTDFHGVLAEPGTEWSLPALMRSARLSLWPFDHLVGDPGQFSPYRRKESRSPKIDLRTGYAAYVQNRRDAGTDHIPKKELLARKLAREKGELRFTFHSLQDEAMQKLIRWKSEQYDRTDNMDRFSVPWTGQLLRHIAATQTPDFAGVCSVLEAGDRMVAVHFGMRSRTNIHYWFPAYDRELAKYSAGGILLLRLIEAAAESGLQTMDLGKGDSLYKRQLMTGATPLTEGVVVTSAWWKAALKLRHGFTALQNHDGLGQRVAKSLKTVVSLVRPSKLR